MRRAQFTSPLIILTIIIISTLLLATQAGIRTSLESKTTQLSSLFNKHVIFSIKDLNYQNNITSESLKLLSTVNNTETIQDILKGYNVTRTSFENNKVILEYDKIYKTVNYSKNYQNVIVIKYPYTRFTQEEKGFNRDEFRNCVQNHDCEYCVNEYDSGTVNWELIVCLKNPLRVKIQLKHSEKALTQDYPYKIFNNSLILME